MALGYRIEPALVDETDRLADDRIALFTDAATPFGADDLERLRRATAKVIRLGIPAGTVRAWVARSTGGAWLGSAVVAIIQRLPTPANPTGREAYLAQMYVVPAARGLGAGRALLDAAVADGRALAIPVMRLRTTVAGRPLYERYGFANLADVMQLALGDHPADYT